MAQPWIPPTGDSWEDLDLYLRSEQSTRLSIPQGDGNSTDIEGSVNWIGERLMNYTYLDGLSIIGNETSASGNATIITASSDFEILRRSGTGLGFGSIDISKSAAVGSTILRYQNGGTGLAIIGSAGQFLRVNSGATGYEFVNGIPIVTVNNGLTETSGVVQLGGDLVKNTSINTATFNLAITQASSHVTTFFDDGSLKMGVGSAYKFSYLKNGYNAGASVVISALGTAVTPIGTFHNRGSGTTVASVNAIFENASSQSILRLHDDGQLVIGQGGSSIYPFLVSTPDITQPNIRVFLGATTQNAANGAFSLGGTNFAGGTPQFVLGLQKSFVSSAAGAADFGSILINPTINQTGSGTGYTYGILNIPTITSAYNYRAFEFSTSAVYAPSSAVPNYAFSLITPNINASANNQNIVGLDIRLTGSNGAFTGVTRTALGLSGGGLRITGLGTGTDQSIWVQNSTGTLTTPIFATYDDGSSFFNGGVAINKGITAAAYTLDVNGSVRAFETDGFYGSTSGNVMQYRLYKSGLNAVLDRATTLGLQFQYNGSTQFDLSTTGVVSINNLAGGGTKLVAADNSGSLISAGTIASLITLQNAYVNSTQPQITVDDTYGAVIFKNDRAAANATTTEWHNTLDVSVASIDITGRFIANEYVKAGGLSTQFLKADGSVDSSTYITIASVTLQNAYTNSLSIPQVTVTDALGAATWRSGRASNTSNVTEWQSIAGATTASINGNGGFKTTEILLGYTTSQDALYTFQSNGRLYSKADFTNSNGLYLENIGTNTGSGVFVTLQNQIGKRMTIFNDNSLSFISYIGMVTNHSFAIRTNALERLIVSEAGNVTIGSSTTTSLLNVGSSAQLQIASTGALTSSSTAQFTRMGLGVAPTAGYVMRVSESITGGGGIAYGIRLDSIVQNDVTTSANAFASTIGVVAGATLSSFTHFVAGDGTLGAGATIANQYGFRVATLSNGTNNYAFYGGLSSGGGRYNFYAAGSAPNYFMSTTSIGTTATTSLFNVGNSAAFQINTTGAIIASTGINASGLARIISTSGVQLDSTGATGGVERSKWYENASNIIINRATSTGFKLQLANTDQMEITSGGTFTMTHTTSLRYFQYSNGNDVVLIGQGTGATLTTYNAINATNTGGSQMGLSNNSAALSISMTAYNTAYAGTFGAKALADVGVLQFTKEGIIAYGAATGLSIYTAAGTLMSAWGATNANRYENLQVGNAGLSTGNLYKDTAANILANGDLVVGIKV